MSASVFPGMLGGYSIEQLDAMALGELLEVFDRQCREAQAHGLWLFERAPDFSRYCMDRIPRLARLASGEHRRGKP